MRFGLVLAIVAALTGVAHAQMPGGEPRARLQLESRDVYAGMPFSVLVVAEGFDEDPAPAQPALVVDGAKVTPIGVEPQVTRMSVNGQRYDSVTWVFRWRIEASKAGTYTVPGVTVTQGAKTATASGGNLAVTEIAATDDMKLELHVPDRPIWLGESVPVEIDWLLRKDVEDQQLAVPLLSMPDDFAVTAPPAADPRSVLPFPAGATDLQLPYVQDTHDGYTRFKFTVMVTPQRAGTITLPAAQVVASLRIGTVRDRMGFPTARTQLFRASDVERTIEVKPLPQQGRPDSFAGAVGTSFSIGARTSRSVVQLGEPLDLELTVVGDTRLDGLNLGSLSAKGRLSADRFAMPDTVPPGELSDDGKTKVFRVSVQVTDPATTEIPPIELAWFDPVAGAYRTTKSEPIALLVKGGTVVGASDVKATRRPTGEPARADDVSLVGADLALSAPGAALDRPLGGALLWALVLALYLVPLGVLGLRVWQRRTAGAREEAGEVSAARKKVEAELARAATAPGRDVAAPLTTALRSLRKLLAQTGGDDVLARIETEGFARAAGEQPLSAPLRADAAALLARWLDDRRGRKRTGAAAVLVLAALGNAGTARADDLETGRSAYSEAMAAVDPTLRQDAFARAADAFAAAAAAHPDSPELLADWGNAALGAADFGTATLAYRRALRIDGDHARARRNLAWLRARLADNLRPRDGGAASTLFFFHDDWQRSTRLLVGAGAFAVMALLLVPWRRRPRGGRFALAAVPALIWILMSGSVVLQGDAGADGVVIESQVLRSADNAGAPAAQATPLPPGVEVTIEERRPGWARIRTPGGAAGWVSDLAVAAVVP